MKVLKIRSTSHRLRRNASFSVKVCYLKCYTHTQSQLQYSYSTAVMIKLLWPRCIEGYDLQMSNDMFIDVL